jgi:hypothetical protein
VWVPMREYDTEDYQQIKEWFQKRNMGYPSPKSLPKIGFIVDGLASGFLIQTDTCIAVIDFLISDPESELSKRRLALDQISESLLSAALRLGYSGVKCTTIYEPVAKRAKDYGFAEIGLFRTFYRRLNHG